MFINTIRRFGKSIDWILFLATLPIMIAGLLTMDSFSGHSTFFDHQIIWICISFIVFFVVTLFDLRFLKNTRILMTLYGIICGFLALLFIMGHVSKGAQSWFSLGLFAVQPSDIARIILILVLAKYFSRRHVEIANIRHIIVSGAYAFILFALILIQPDLGYAITIFFIWLGMVLVSGIKIRHLAAVFLICGVVFGGAWVYALKPYQKDRIITFIHPLADIRGAGYNAYQSTIAIGSGQILGKGIGYGTQSKLNFLPEYQTDFIFAAFAEEWGFVGVLILLALFCVVIWRILLNALHGASNFEVLYTTGIAILLIINFTVNIGMNIGLLPVTGVTVPFMSYGGSHLVSEFLALGILMSMRRYRNVNTQLE